MIRDEFEKLFPVPEGVEFIEAENTYGAIGLADRFNIKAAVHQRALWQGFQAGHAAGLERAAEEADNYESSFGSMGSSSAARALRSLAAAIRAMKEQKK